TPTVQEFQEVATAVRTVSEIRRVFTYNGLRAVVVRGTTDQLALAAWLFPELDQSANRQAMHEYHMPGVDDNVVRVFYVAHAPTVQQFQEIAKQTRTLSKIRRMFTYNTPRAIIARGTTDQISMAERLIADRDK